jgi:formiminoglutamate deiminase
LSAGSRWWCELAWLGAERAEPGVLVEADGERIRSVERSVSGPPAGATRLDGLTVPGLANSHSHAFQRALRGRAQRGGGSFWTWRDEMYAVAERLDPDSYAKLARATFAEMALAGVTAVGEFHYLHHASGGDSYDDPNEMGRVLRRAAAEAGIRITLIDACYLHGGIDRPPSGAQRRFCDRDAEAWAERVDAFGPDEGMRLGAAIHSVRAVDPESAAAVAEWATARGAPLHAHVSEQPDEDRDCVEAYGQRPLGLLAHAGALHASFTAVHGTHLEPAEVEALGAAGGWCCVCPTTERDLGDGIGPGRELTRAGARLCLGSDSHAVIDLLEEARALELDERLATGERGVHATAALLRAATEHGHACLGWPDAGRIEAGARADLVNVSLDGVRLAGTEPETALEALVFAGAAGDVRRVIVAGREVVRDGAHVDIDVPRELDRTIRAVVG